MCLCNAAPSYSNPVFKISTDINKTGKVLMLPKEADKSENHAQKWSYPSWHTCVLRVLLVAEVMTSSRYQEDFMIIH